MESKLFHVQYITRPAGKVANKNVKATGIHAKILAWIGSGGVGFKRCCKNKVTPINNGQTPRFKKSGNIDVL